MSVDIPNGYKQTKVGVIPEDWEVVKLGDIFYEIRDKIGEKDIETYSISAGKGFVSQKNIAVPNVFISFDFKEKDMSTQYYAKLFEHHFLDRGLRRIISSSARMDGLLNINKKYFFELPIIKPPLKEQQKIAQILTTWDEAISKQEQHITTKERVKKGLMQRLLMGEVRVKV